MTPPDPTPTIFFPIQTLPSSTHQQNLPNADSVLCFFERGLLILVHEKRHPHDDHQDKEVLGDGVALPCYQDTQHHHWDGLDGLPQHLQQSTNQSVNQSREKLLLNIHGGKQACLGWTTSLSTISSKNSKDCCVLTDMHCHE